MSLVIFAQTPVVVHPSKAPFDNPTFRNDLEALRVIIPLDDLNLPLKAFFDLLLPLISFKTTISPDQLQPSANLLSGQMPKRFFCAFTLRHAGGQDQHFQPISKRVADYEAFASAESFGAVIASLEEAREPPFAVVFTL
jgi:hypothetical protein